MPLPLTSHVTPIVSDLTHPVTDVARTLDVSSKTAPEIETAAALVTTPMMSSPAPMMASAVPHDATAIAPVLAQNFAAADQGDTSLGGGGAKFAASDENLAAGRISELGTPDKTFLSTLEKRVTSATPSLGTSVAKTSAAMTFDRPTTAALPEHADVQAATVASVESPAPTAPVEASAASGAAHRAVEAVLTAVERFSSGDRHAVDLQFAVGGSNLSVRVELRADEVRTVFHTDSPELRTALTHAWQAESGGATERSFRLTTPVFSSADSGHLGAFSGDSAPRQNNPGAQRAADENFATVASRVRGDSATASVTTESTLAAARPAAPATTLHLHAFA